MVARVSGNSSIHHGNPADNASTSTRMVSCVSGIRISHHSYPADNGSVNRSSRHGDPTDNTSTGEGKYKTIYVGKNE